MNATLTGKDRKQFRMELALALIITGLACAAGMSNYLLASNEFYPGATDALGHFAKIQYIADSLISGHIPSWFPYWYCGSAATQYYPWLSYYVMVPIYAITGNVMLTFKIYSFTMLFTAGIGVWKIFRTFIGKWGGLFASVTFCFQPYILGTLFSQGQIAQGVIIALAPWYFLYILQYWKSPTRKHFIICTFICSLMILSHPNSIFLYALCIMVTLAFFLPLKKILVQTYFAIGLSIFFSGILTAFWSIVGVTQLENPGVPYLLKDAALLFTATKDWFLTDDTILYFGISITICSILAILLYAYRKSAKKIDREIDQYILFSIIFTILSALLSFGLRMPLFKYLPMSESVMAGKILCMMAISASILCGFLVTGLYTLASGKKTIVKLFSGMMCVIVISAILWNLNPLKTNYIVLDDSSFRNMVSTIDLKSGNFDKGRYSFVGPFDCSQTYFPIQYDLNIAEGFNIEGTPHNKVIWGQILANASGNWDYIAKNLVFWNVRYVLLEQRYGNISGALSKYMPIRLKNNNENDKDKLYYSNYPSSYFLIDHRNSIILGAGAPGLAMEFPYLVYDQRNDITDYTLEELENYKLIYLCEPEVSTLRDKNTIENMVEKLAERGVTVIIEPAIAKGYALFDVTVADVVLEEEPFIQKQLGSKIISTADDIKIDEGMKYGRAAFGLDNVYYKLIQNGGRLENDIIGTKIIKNGEVIFIGKHLSQYLKAVYIRNWGAPENPAEFPKCSEEVKALFEDIYSTYGVNKNFWPDPFPVKNAEWNYKGTTFGYSSAKTQEVTVSVTYSPRWKATVDSKPIPVGQRENLITLELPAGNHEVQLVYGLTKYGIAGYIISGVGLIIFLLFIKFYDIIMYKFRQISAKVGNYLQISGRD